MPQELPRGHLASTTRVLPYHAVVPSAQTATGGSAVEEVVSFLRSCTPEQLDDFRATLTVGEAADISDVLEESERRHAREHFPAFCRRYLPQYFSVEPAEQHPGLMADLHALVEGNLLAADGGTALGLAVAMPRGWAKSTIASLAFAMWCALTKRRHYILLVSDTDEQVRERARDIRDELEGNDLLRADYGDLAPLISERGSYGPTRGTSREKWTEKDFVLRNGVRFAARNTGSNVRGLRTKQYRPDLIICDDIQRDEAVRTGGRRSETMRWFRKSLLGTLAPSGKIVVLGTVMHNADLMTHLVRPERVGKDEFPRFARMAHAGVRGLQIGYEALRILTGESTWPAWRPIRRTPETPKETKTLEEELQLLGSSIAFQQEIQNEPIDEETTKFKAEWLDAAKHRGAGLTFLRAPPSMDECWFYLTAWDLSLLDDPKKAREKDSDWTVGLTMGLTKTDHIRLLRGVRARGLTPVGVRDLIKREALLMRPHVVVLENNSFGRIHELELRAGTGLPIVGQTTDGRKHHLADGLPGLAVPFEGGQILLPYGDVESRAFVDVLCDEFHGFGVEPHDDILMCFWIGWTRLRMKVGTRHGEAEIAAINAGGTRRSSILREVF